MALFIQWYSLGSHPGIVNINSFMAGYYHMIGRDHGSLNHRLWMDIWVVGGFDDYKSSCYKHFYAVFVCEYKSSLFWDK